MAFTFKTSAQKKKFRLTPQNLAKTVGNSIYEAVTNRTQRTAAETSAPPPEWDVYPRQAPIIPEPQNATWPMPVERFQYGHFLEPGDVLLTTRLESFFSFLSRTFDDSHFAHSALTFVTPRTYPAVDRSYLIEATFSGIDLNSLSEMILPTKAAEGKKKKPRYIVGIKRLEADWFTSEMRPLVGGRMLRFIKDDNYNFSLLAALAADKSRWFFRVRDFFFGRAPTIKEHLNKTKKYAPVEFICSGFVQYAYVDMITQAVEAGMLSPRLAEKARDDVMFADWITAKSSMEDVMAVKPRELASTPRLQWKYLIYGGLVHKVDTEKEVNDFFDAVNSDTGKWTKP